MSDIILIDKQNEAMKEILQWYETKSKPYYVLSGIAGSGKTTLLAYILKQLNCRYITCAYTGMATCVLMKKGVQNAITIHKLIYDTKIIEDENHIEHVYFTLKEKLDCDYDLIVVEEYSMVDNKIINDLLSFNVPILFVGDPEQLPPVYGDNFLKYDFFLDEPMRQSLENPVIWLANKVRNKDFSALKPSVIGNTIRIFSKNNFSEDFFSNDQILAGKNKTCSQLNKFYRQKFLKYENNTIHKGEKIMCLKNNWDIINGESFSLVNGLIGKADNIIIKPKANLYEFDFQPDFTLPFRNILSEKLLFDGIRDEEHLVLRKKQLFIYRMNYINKGIKINDFNFAYVITCNKSQGSEFDSVGLYAEILRRDTYYRWLYTGITRTRNKIDIVL